MFKFINHSEKDLNNLKSYLDDFIPFFTEVVPFNKPVEIIVVSDKKNFKNDLGKTAEYLPNEYKVVIYSDGRHIKDMLRSISHELVHHYQNCNGKFDKETATKLGYAQEDSDLRKMEKEAYLKGNMVFRDWEDSKKKQEVKKIMERRKNRMLDHVEQKYGFKINFNNNEDN